jgi:hypothetical protein
MTRCSPLGLARSLAVAALVCVPLLPTLSAADVEFSFTPYRSDPVQEAAAQKERKEREEREQKAAQIQPELNRTVGARVAEALNAPASAPKKAPPPQRVATEKPKDPSCRQVELPPDYTKGFGDSQAEALQVAMSRTRGCKVLSQSCDSSAKSVDIKGGKIVASAARTYACGISFSCGKTREVCDHRPSGASRQ